MKTIFTSLLISLSFISFSQEEPDSIYYYTANSLGEYSPEISRSIYTIYQDSLEISIDVIDSSANLINRNLRNVYIYSNCSDNNYSQIKQYIYNDFVDLYSLNQTFYNTFDSNCKISEIYLWLESNQDTAFLIKYEDVNDWGYAKSDQFYLNDFNSGNLTLQSSSERVFEFDANDLLIKIDREIKYPNGGLSNFRDIIKYNDDHKQVLFTSYIYDSSTEQYSEITRSESIYENNLIVKKSFEINGIDLDLTILDSLYLDEKGRTKIKVTNFYNLDSSLNRKEKYVYFYPESSSTTNLFQNHSFNINKVISNNSTLSFEIDNYDKENLFIKVIDNMGRTYYHSNTTTKDWQSPEILLNKGLFLINVTSKNGTITRKVIVH